MSCPRWPAESAGCADSVPVQIGTLAGALRDHAAEFVEGRHLAPAIRAFLDPRGG